MWGDWFRCLVSFSTEGTWQSSQGQYFVALVHSCLSLCWDPCPQSALTGLSCDCPPVGWEASGGSSAGTNKDVLCDHVRNWSQYWLFSTWLLWSFLIGQELSWHLNVTASSTGRNSNCSHIFFCSPFLLSCTHPRPLPLSGGLKWWWLKVSPARKWLASLSNQRHLNSFLPCIFSWKWKITANRAYLLKAVNFF